MPLKISKGIMASELGRNLNRQNYQKGYIRYLENGVPNLKLYSRISGICIVPDKLKGTINILDSKTIKYSHDSKGHGN